MSIKAEITMSLFNFVVRLSHIVVQCSGWI